MRLSTSRIFPAQEDVSVGVQCPGGRSGQQGCWIAARERAKYVDEVGVQAAVLEAAGGVGGDQAGDALFAGFGLAAEAEPAVDDCAAERAFGVVVGGLDVGVFGERPQCGPDLQQGASEASALAVARMV